MIEQFAGTIAKKINAPERNGQIAGVLNATNLTGGAFEGL